MAGGLLGSPMVRAHIPDLLELGIRKVYMDQYDLIDNQFEKIYNMKSSKKKIESEVVGGGLGTFRLKSEGNSPYFDNGQEAWKKTYTHSTWALGIEITEEGMEDDIYDFYTGMGRELGYAGAYTQQVEAMDLFNNAASATVYTASSTAYKLLETAHYRIDGGTWSNRPTTYVDLSIESYEAALTSWRTNMKDQRGRVTTIKPSILMVGPSDEFIARRILESDKRPFSADNDPNVAKTSRNVTVFVNDFMTDDGRWFLLAPKAQTGLVYNTRVSREMRRRDDPRTGNMLMVARYRESHGASHVTGIYGSL